MYDRDMPVLRDHALRDPAGLTDVITFVLLTIQQPLQQVAGQMADVRRHGETSRYLFGSKRDGYRYAVENAGDLYRSVMDAVNAGDAIAAIDVVSAVPGLGIVKAAFVAQIVGLEVACLDTHNLRHLGLPESAFKVGRVKRETKLKKIRRYVDVCTETGGARFWWNRWCDYVAGRRRSPLATGDAVSAFHVQCVI